MNQKEFVQLSYEALRNSYEFTNGMSHEAAVAAARAALSSNLGGEQYNPFKNYTFQRLSILLPSRYVLTQLPHGITIGWTC